MRHPDASRGSGAVETPPRGTPRGRDVPAESSPSGVLWHLDDFVCFRDRVWLRGWAFHPHERIRAVEVTLPGGSAQRLDSFGLESPDVAVHHGDAALSCRFEESIQVPLHSAEAAQELGLRFRLGRRHPDVSVEIRTPPSLTDPSVALMTRFFDGLAELPAGRVVELGARERSGTSLREWVPAHLEYVGVDILPGPGVDVIADAHQLGSVLAPGSVDVVYSVSVFEHLLMPWRVALELNSVLRAGGLVFIQTHQTWPVHDEPWDYWRFSADSWTALFNARTGFEIVEAVMGQPARVVAESLHGPTFGLADQPGYLASSVLARKVSGTDLRWDVEVRDVTDSTYPA